MCNDYEQQIRWAEHRRALDALELGMPAAQSETDLPRADHIRIGDIGPVMRASGNSIELTPMRFGYSRHSTTTSASSCSGKHFCRSSAMRLPASTI
jgi:hypothetical protein